MKTKLWKSEDGCSSTMVQVRDDDPPRLVWMNTNLGWIVISNAPSVYDEAAVFAEEIARGYGLVEVAEREAIYWATGEWPATPEELAELEEQECQAIADDRRQAEEFEVRNAEWIAQQRDWQRNGPNG